MDKENVIDLSNNLRDLNIDMQNWQAMSYNMRKRSDDACIARYGINNTQLYELLRSMLIDDEFKKRKEQAVSESDVDGDNDPNLRISQINKSKEVQDQTGEAIIDDWLGDKPLPNYGEYLQAQYNKYIALTPDMRENSDQSSLSIWGYTVPNMYNIMLNKWNAYKELNDDEDVVHPDTLQNYVSDVDECVTNSDVLGMLVRKLDINTYRGTLYENSVLENLCDTIDDNIDNGYDYSSDVPLITPWFTPDEMENITGSEVDPYDYVLGNNSQELHEKIKEAMASGNEDEILRLGWNPKVEYTPESADYARKRQIRWFNENKQIQIIDLSKFDVPVTEDTEEEVKHPILKLEPIYIVLISHEGFNSKAIRAATRSKYSHAGIAFDERLDRIYTFNAATPDGRSGFSIESLDFYLEAKNPKLKVITIFVSPEVKQKMQFVVDAYAKNKGRTYYDWSDLFRILLKKSKDTMYSLGMICSQFVDTVLKACNIDLTGKPSNLVTPKDFDMLTKNGAIARAFVMYDGLVKNYKVSDVQRKVITLISRAKDPDSLLTKPLKEALNMIFGQRDLNGLYVKTDNEKANQILAEIRTVITPSAIIGTPEKIPVGYEARNEMYIDRPSNNKIAPSTSAVYSPLRFSGETIRAVEDIKKSMIKNYK